jgi:NAD(P)-dependent dehydrogenase (short-subunit alcohol dehydrogenase family)
MGRLDGKVALISGGARGQGACEARMFCREGAKVVFGDILDAAGKATEADIRAAGGEASYVHLNVTSEADWHAAVETAERLYGALHILVNNAGILIRKSIEATTEDDWDRIMAVNVKGVFLGTKHAIPAMRWWRVDHQYLLDCRPGGQPWHDLGLHSDQGRRAPLHQGHRDPARQGQDSLQLGAPWSYCHRYDQGHARKPRSVGAAPAAFADAACRDPGRCGLRCVIPGLR